jgi:hypothetical protein
MLADTAASHQHGLNGQELSALGFPRPSNCLTSSQLAHQIQLRKKSGQKYRKEGPAREKHVQSRFPRKVTGKGGEGTKRDFQYLMGKHKIASQMHPSRTGPKCEHPSHDRHLGNIAVPMAKICQNAGNSSE